jgi:hypothetical protein
MYSPKLKADIHSIPVPYDFVMDIVYYDLDPRHPYIGLRFYESHWRSMSEKQRRACAVYLDTIKKIVEAHGMNCTLDPVYDQPGTQKL